MDFGLNLYRSNSFLSFRKCHFKRNILPYVSSSILSFPLLIWLLVGTNFNPWDNNEISALVSFCLDKLTTLLLTDFITLFTLPSLPYLHYLIHLNGNMNGTLVDRNLDEEIVLDITGFHDAEALD